MGLVKEKGAGDLGWVGLGRHSCGLGGLRGPGGGREASGD